LRRRSRRRAVYGPEDLGQYNRHLVCLLLLLLLQGASSRRETSSRGCLRTRRNQKKRPRRPKALLPRPTAKAARTLKVGSTNSAEKKIALGRLLRRTKRRTRRRGSALLLESALRPESARALGKKNGRNRRPGSGRALTESARDPTGNVRALTASARDLTASARGREISALPSGGGPGRDREGTEGESRGPEEAVAAATIVIGAVAAVPITIVAATAAATVTVGHQSALRQTASQSALLRQLLRPPPTPPLSQRSRRLPVRQRRRLRGARLWRAMLGRRETTGPRG